MWNADPAKPAWKPWYLWQTHLDVSVDYLLSGSINNSVIGPMPKGLSNQQRTALKEILTTIQDNLSEWEKDQ